MYIVIKYVFGDMTTFKFTNSLFEAVKLTRNGDPDKYSYFGYDIGFNACWALILEKYILVLGPTIGFDDATIKEKSWLFYQFYKKLSLH